MPSWFFGSSRARPRRPRPPGFLVPVPTARLEMGHLAATAHSSVLRTLRTWVPPGNHIIARLVKLWLGRPLVLHVISPSSTELLPITMTAVARGAAARAGLASAGSALLQAAVVSAAMRCMLATTTASPTVQPRTTRAARCSGGAAGIGAVAVAPQPSRCPVAMGPSLRSSACRSVAPHHLGTGPPHPTVPRTFVMARPYHVLRRGVVSTTAKGNGAVPLQTAEEGHPRESPTRTDASTAPAVARSPARPATVAHLALGGGGG